MTSVKCCKDQQVIFASQTAHFRTAVLLVVGVVSSLVGVLSNIQSSNADMELMNLQVMLT